MMHLFAIHDNATAFVSVMKQILKTNGPLILKLGRLPKKRMSCIPTL